MTWLGWSLDEVTVAIDRLKVEMGYDQQEHWLAQLKKGLDAADYSQVSDDLAWAFPEQMPPMWASWLYEHTKTLLLSAIEPGFMQAWQRFHGFCLDCRSYIPIEFMTQLEPLDAHRSQISVWLLDMLSHPNQDISIADAGEPTDQPKHVLKLWLQSVLTPIQADISISHNRLTVA